MTSLHQPIGAGVMASMAWASGQAFEKAEVLIPYQEPEEPLAAAPPPSPKPSSSPNPLPDCGFQVGRKSGKSSGALLSTNC